LQICSIKGRVYGSPIKEKGFQKQRELSGHDDNSENERHVRQDLGHSEGLIFKKNCLQSAKKYKKHTRNASNSLELHSTSSSSLRDDSFYTNDSSLTYKAAVGFAEKVVFLKIFIYTVSFSLLILYQLWKHIKREFYPHYVHQNLNSQILNLQS
jgi:hypothetical protein